MRFLIPAFPQDTSRREPGHFPFTGIRRISGNLQCHPARLKKNVPATVLHPRIHQRTRQNPTLNTSSGKITSSSLVNFADDRRLLGFALSGGGKSLLYRDGCALPPLLRVEHYLWLCRSSSTPDASHFLSWRVVLPGVGNFPYHRLRQTTVGRCKTIIPLRPKSPGATGAQNFLLSL